MLVAGMTIVVALICALSGYVLGQKNERRRHQESRTIYVRPHTEKTIEQYPLPEERTEPDTVQNAQWSRTNLPNSGVRWS